MASKIGINAALVHPEYLHSISTTHTWIFSAIAELIDNACDTDVEARDLWIDKETIGDQTCLTFVDNGSGMNRDKLFKMLSFGFNEKEDNGKQLAIGRYGIGFKSGSMRIGSDAIVITRDVRSLSVGLLSQSYLSAIHAESVMIPIVSWDITPSGLTRKRSLENVEGLKAILKHSIFTTEVSLSEALDEKLGKTKLGTKIIIYNLKKDSSGNLELDFVSDKNDIRNPENAMVDQRANVMERKQFVSSPEHRRSLMVYCSILYLKPRMKIILRGKKVKTQWIEKTLSQRENDTYNPSWADTRLGVTLKFGFTHDKRANAPYGLMVYHKNRLIVAYKKIGCQKKPDEGVGVIGVVEANFLDVTNNKQNFKQDTKYIAFINNAATKLNDYYNEKTFGVSSATADDDIKSTCKWVQCDNCRSFRRLPRTYNEELPEQWYCKDNPDPQYNRCELPEETVEKDEEEVQAKPTYEKTVKKMMVEQKRQAKLEEERKAKETEEALKATEEALDAAKEEGERLKIENEEALRKEAEAKEALKKEVEKKKPIEVLDYIKTDMVSKDRAKDYEPSSREGYLRRGNINKTPKTINTTKATQAFQTAVEPGPNCQADQQGLQRFQDRNQTEIKTPIDVKQGQSLHTPQKRKYPGRDNSDERVSRSRGLDGNAVVKTLPVGGSPIAMTQHLGVSTIAVTNPACGGDKTPPPGDFSVSRSPYSTPGTSASSGTHRNASPSGILANNGTYSTSIRSGTTATNSTPGISVPFTACGVNTPHSKFVPCRTSLDFSSVNSNIKHAANDRTGDKNEVEDDCKLDEQGFKQMINVEEVGEMKVFQHQGSQTMEYGTTEQSQALIRTTQELNNLKTDIWSLLKIVLPGRDLGDQKNIGKFVKDLLKGDD